MKHIDGSHYSMVIEWSDEDQMYVVSLPEWGPGAKTHGKTYDEAVRMGQEALELLIESYQQEGDPLPQPRTYAAVGH
jgi:predicted RNase H-like HicB family nuclease